MTTVWPFSNNSHNSPDNNVNEICKEFVERSQHGFKKYGTTTERTDLDLQQWLTHLKEELMDAVVYIHRAKKELALERMTRNSESLNLYNDNNMSTVTIGGDTVISTVDYGAGMPAAMEITDISLLSSGDTITISLDKTNEPKQSI